MSGIHLKIIERERKKELIKNGGVGGEGERERRGKIGSIGKS